MSTTDDGKYVYALRFKFLTRIYDPIMARLMREQSFKTALIGQAGIKGSWDVLDLGCGTGTMTLMGAAMYPDVKWVGVDGDKNVLGIARAKTGAGSVQWDHALVSELPYPSNTFDRIVSSVVFHHLDPLTKRAAAAEAYRVLRPGGSIHIADWGRARNPLMRAAFWPVQLLDGFKNTRDHVAGRLPVFLTEAGFKNAGETCYFSTLLGTLSLYSATKK